MNIVSVPAQQVERITMAGGPPAGMFGIFATGIGTYLSKAAPNLNVSVATTAGSVANLGRINSGDAEIGMSFSGDVHEGVDGHPGMGEVHTHRDRSPLLRRRSP